MLQKCCKIKGMQHSLWVDTLIPPLQWDEFFLKAWSWLAGGLFQGYVQFKMKFDPVQYENKVKTIEGIHSLNLLGENNIEHVKKHPRRITCQ